MMGNVLVPGFPSDQSVYRSKITGQYGMVVVVEIIKSLWVLKEGPITLGCDRLNALKEALYYFYELTSSDQKEMIF